MGQVNQLVVVGDYANGIDSGTIEMIIVGNAINQPYLEQLSPKIQSLIDRKVSFHMQEEVWLGKGIVLYNKIEKEVDEDVKVYSRQLKIKEFVEDTVMEK